MTRRRQRGQRGFTLIELMVALLVSSLLVGMILAIFLRMSLAYRGQQQVAGVQQVLAAARAAFEQDAKQAGLLMAQGFTTAQTPLGQRHKPVTIRNNVGAAGYDEIGFYYADPSAQAAVDMGVGAIRNNATVDVDSSDGFEVGDLVVMVQVSTTASPLGGSDAPLATFDACVMRLAGKTPTRFQFETSAPWGSAGIPGNSHCTFSPTPSPRTMYYKLIARSYRIDPSRPAEGVLQVSPTGNLVPALNDWQDLAVGFTDIQVATQFFDNDGIDTADADTDAAREWYSSTAQQNLTEPAAIWLAGGTMFSPIQMTISLVARTERNVEGIATGRTPQLKAPPDNDHNNLGDRDPINLPSALAHLVGDRIYRYTTFRVDLRNLGVGR